MMVVALIGEGSLILNPPILLLGRKSISLEDVLQFWTGSRCIPAVGFEKPLAIAFTDVDQLPTVSTCSLTLTLPRLCAALSTDKFRERMDACVLGSFGSGNV